MLGNNAFHVSPPNVGDTSRRDVNSFPYYPALFVSDVTTDSNNRSGDAENGGTPHIPSDVYGAWKTYTSLNQNPWLGIPTQNETNLGPGADSFPTSSNVTFTSFGQKPVEQGYSAEIVWKVDDLGLTQGHNYRAEFILHDGDVEGDVSEGCAFIRY